MSNRTVYIIGLLGIIGFSSTLTLAMAATDHLEIAADALKWGVTGAFLWGFLKDSGSEESVA